jgi:hypothetical protein
VAPDGGGGFGEKGGGEKVALYFLAGARC